MYSLTRGPITLLAAGAAGFLVWISTQIGGNTTGGYWAKYGIIAGAGLVMALSQLIGGWTKWGWPRISPSVLLFGFLPAAIAVGWIVFTGQPHANASQRHVMDWSDDVGIGGLVRDMLEYLGALAFGLGLVFGFSFDTTGEAARPALRKWREERAEPQPTAAGDGARASERESERATTPSGPTR